MRIRKIACLSAAVCCILLTMFHGLPWEWGIGLTLLPLAFGFSVAVKKSAYPAAPLDFARLSSEQMTGIR